MIKEQLTLKHSLIEMVQNKNMATYINCQGQKLMYRFTVEDIVYEFPIDIGDKDEVGNAIFEQEHKCITLMRYIRKAIESNEIRWYKK